jgi:hypothetical protein
MKCVSCRSTAKYFEALQDTDWGVKLALIHVSGTGVFVKVHGFNDFHADYMMQFSKQLEMGLRKSKYWGLNRFPAAVRSFFQSRASPQIWI